MLEIRTKRVKTIVILQLVGSIDIDSAGLIEKIGVHISDGYNEFLCDFGEVTLVDYSGLSALALAYKNVVNHKGKMKFFNVPGHVVKLFTLVCLDKVFEVYPDEKKAVKSFEVESAITHIQQQHLRRRFKRLPLDIAIKFRVLGEQSIHHGKVLNISAVGMLVYASKALPLGEILEVTMSLAPVVPEVTVKTKVVWLVQKEIQPHIYPGMGLEFYLLDPHMQEKIIEFVERNLPLDSDIP
jgi:anti-anti-sigma factor